MGLVFYFPDRFEGGAEELSCNQWRSQEELNSRNLEEVSLPVVPSSQGWVPVILHSWNQYSLRCRGICSVINLLDLPTDCHVLKSQFQNIASNPSMYSDANVPREDRNENGRGRGNGENHFTKSALAGLQWESHVTKTESLIRTDQIAGTYPLERRKRDQMFLPGPSFKSHKQWQHP